MHVVLKKNCCCSQPGLAVGWVGNSTDAAKSLS